jgi:hypothetical protein
LNKFLVQSVHVEPLVQLALRDLKVTRVTRAMLANVVKKVMLVYKAKSGLKAYRE